jgi:hypothetical protein
MQTSSAIGPRNGMAPVNRTMPAIDPRTSSDRPDRELVAWSGAAHRT